jgi:hypothetical protein
MAGLLETMDPMAKDMMMRGWSALPVARGSFIRIFETPAGIGFRLTPCVHSERVMELPGHVGEVPAIPKPGFPLKFVMLMRLQVSAATSLRAFPPSTVARGRLISCIISVMGVSFFHLVIFSYFHIFIFSCFHIFMFSYFHVFIFSYF